MLYQVEAKRKQERYNKQKIIAMDVPLAQGCTMFFFAKGSWCNGIEMFDCQDD